jgi:two-component system sensor histidine kinase HydH
MMPYHEEWKRVVLITTLIAGVLCLNYFTLYRMTYEHAFYRVLSYIPLILGSFWFGIKGAVTIAIGMILLFLPYGMVHWHGFSLEDFHEIMEGVLYFCIAFILGVLIERERKKQRALVEAESLAAVGRTVLELAHDMKTPLMAIGGFATQISRALDRDDPKQKKLRVVIHETACLETMVREMLDFGKPAELQFKRTNLNDLVQEIMDVIRPVAEKCQVVLKTDPDPLLPSLMLDGPKVKQALLNLVMNALQASPAGEHVIVKTAGYQQGVNLYVMDGGAGIDREDVEKIFEPFFTKKSKGTGLGLPIVKKIVAAHQGKIHFDGNEKKGVTFTIRFPAQQKGITTN